MSIPSEVQELCEPGLTDSSVTAKERNPQDYDARIDKAGCANVVAQSSFQPIQHPESSSTEQFRAFAGMQGMDGATSSNAPNDQRSNEHIHQWSLQDIRRYWRRLSSPLLVEAMSNPSFTDEICHVMPNMSDEQIATIGALMSDDQIREAVPRLQLEQQGVLIQTCSSSQVRVFVESVPTNDRELLLQNITLLTSFDIDPSGNEELQSLIGFIDPLAMAIAIEHVELVDRVIEAACIMIPEQIRVIVPLLNASQARKMIEVINSPENHHVLMQMLMPDIREELAEKCVWELAKYLQLVEHDIVEQLRLFSDKNIPDLKERIQKFDANTLQLENVEDEYHELMRFWTQTKTELENLQVRVRRILIELKTPLCVIPESETRRCYERLEQETKRLAGEIYKQYLILDRGNLTDGLVHMLHNAWIKCGGKDRIESPDNHPVDQISTEDIFVDEERSVLLYEAVQAIGNPCAIGDIYPFTWSDIVDCGFRTSEDFASRGIKTLEQLDQWILNNRPKSD